MAQSDPSISISVSEPLPVGVIGCGRMGRLHARVFSEMPSARLVGLYDVDPDVSGAAADMYGGQRFVDLDEMLGKVKAVTIAVPTNSHVAVAEACLRRKVACLIEKPLAKNVVEAQRIVDCARQNDTLVQVGHIERFNPAIRAMDRLGVKAGFMEVIRISPLTFRSIDVGVVLDMMIHDIDIVLRLANSRVAKIDAVGVSVIGSHEDVCNARLTFENGVVANMTASRLALKTERRLRVFSHDAYLSLDYQKRYGIVVRRSGNLDALRDTAARIQNGEVKDLSEVNYAELVHLEELQIDDTEPLRAELDAFLTAVATGSPSPVPAEDGLAAVETAERIVAAIPPQRIE